MYKFLKVLFLAIPGKKLIYQVLKLVAEPSDRVAGYLKFKGLFTLTLPDNSQIKIYNDNSTLPTLLYWKGIDAYEKCSLETWRKLSKKSSVIYDIGANFGLFGLISKVINPHAEVILFEPLERNVARIKKNFAVNDLMAEINTVAVGDRNGTITFFDMKSDENTIGSIDKSFVEKHKHHSEIVPIEVPLITLDSFVTAINTSKPDLIKIDVEGADYHAIKGGLQTLIKFRPHVVIEITNQDSGKNVLALLGDLPFNYFIYWLDDETGNIYNIGSIQGLDAGNYLFTTLNSIELTDQYMITSSKKDVEII